MNYAKDALGSAHSKRDQASLGVFPVSPVFDQGIGEDGLSLVEGNAVGLLVGRRLFRIPCEAAAQRGANKVSH
jgi:hypothetical protein